MSHSYSRLLGAVLGRQHSFLQNDIAAHSDLIRSSVKGARILVIGAAGSIGGSFVRELVGYAPGGLHLVDISENNLAEVVRDLRSSGGSVPDDFATYALDFGGLEMRALLLKNHYDFVLNFSALKHVRSERDPFTLMRLLDVNVLANARLSDWLVETVKPQKIFAVSSDKAVRSANLMGASKAFMERLFLTRSEVIPFGSARFANVAFSDGSLLHGFGQRIKKLQPITAPSDVRRYFISHQEAGQLCLMGCFTGQNKEIVYPDFRQDTDMLTFSEIAKIFLEESGYTPRICESEEEALSVAKDLNESSREWPCFFSVSDTSGEKMYEEFVDPAETVDPDRFETMGVITSPLNHGAAPVEEALEALGDIRKHGSWSLENLVDVVARVVPEMVHVQAPKNLDQKM